MSIEIKNITKKYGQQVALDHISFSIEENELVGLLGPNGAGKSTLMKIITGYLPADSGEVYIYGQKVDQKDVGYKRLIGYLPEHNPLYLDLYIAEYLKMTAGFYSIKEPSKRIDEIMDLTGLMPESGKKIGALSKGYRQRVGIAQALLHDPKVIILDEPTSGLDPNQLEEIRSLIKSISKNKTIIFSTHIMQEVEALCDRIIIINQGKISIDSSAESIHHLSKQTTQHVFIETVNPIQEIEIISSLKEVNEVKKISPTRYIVVANQSYDDIRPTLFNLAAQNGITLLTLQEESQSIESVFRELTSPNKI